MRFADEPYVRVYKKKTLTWYALGQEGRTVWFHLLQEFDRSGVIDLGEHDPVVGICTLCHLSQEVVEEGLKRCLDLKCVVHVDNSHMHCLFCPNYLPAQEAIQSNALRQKIKRDRAKARERVSILCEDPAIAALVKKHQLELDSDDEPNDTPRVAATRHVSQSQDTQGETDRDTPRVATDTPRVAATRHVSQRHFVTPKADLADPADPADLNASLLRTTYGHSDHEAGSTESSDRPIPLEEYRPSAWLVARFLTYGLTQEEIDQTLGQYREQSRIAQAPSASHDKAFEAFLESTLKGRRHGSRSTNGNRRKQSRGSAGAQSSSARSTPPDPRNGGRPAREYGPKHALVLAKQSLLRLDDDPE